MSITIAITSNWQIHVPQEARVIAGFNKPGKVTLIARPGEIVIKPKQSKILTLAGSLETLYKKNPIDVDNIRDLIDYS